MKTLTQAFKDARDGIDIKTKRRITLTQLGQSENLLTWTDLGRPGTATHIYCTCEHLGDLYVGTAEAGSTGKVYLFVSSGNFTDCGRPGNATHIYDLLSVGGYLFAAVAVTGSTAAARVFRWDGGTSWTDTGLFQDPSSRVEVIGVHNGSMYAGVSATQCKMWKFASMGSWIDCGNVGGGGVSRIMSMLSFSGGFYVGTGTTAYTFKYTAPTTWTDSGRCGVEAYISDLKEHNGNMYAATAQNGKVYRFSGGTTWADYGQLGSQTWVNCLCEYLNELYAGTGKTTSYYPYVYKFLSLNSWSKQGNLTPSGLTGENVLDIIVFNDYLYAGSGGGTGNGHLWTTRIPGEDISIYVEKIQGLGRITKSTERKICLFQPPDISVRAEEPITPMFYKGDKSGLFDNAELDKGYQVQVYNGIEGVDEWVKMFDGKLDEDSAKRPIRETVNFSSMGWLDNLKDYNAEFVADTSDSFVFRNIGGVSIDINNEPVGLLGAVSMEFGIEDGNKYLSYCKGNKNFFSSDQNGYLIWDKSETRGVYLNIDYSELPSESKEDKFVIAKKEGGVKVACYWYENIKPETLVGYLFDAGDITTQDIKMIDLTPAGERSFTYLSAYHYGNSANFTSAVITAIELISYAANVATIIFWVRYIKDSDYTNDENWLFKQTINTSTGEVSTPQAVANGNGFTNGGDNRGDRFFYFASSWWTITGHDIDSGGYGTKEVAYKLYKIDSGLTGVDYTYTFSNDEPIGSYAADSSWHIYLALTSGTFENDDLYIIQQVKNGGIYSGNLIKLHWTGSIISASSVKVLSVNRIFDNVGSCAYQTGNDLCVFYGSRAYFTPLDLYVGCYNITDDVLSNIWNDNVTGYNMIDARGNLNSNNTEYNAVLKWLYTGSSGYYVLYVRKDGSWHSPDNDSKIINIKQSGAVVDKYYTYWYDDTLHPQKPGWKIESVNVENGIIKKEPGILRNDLSYSQGQPLIYDVTGEIISYVGLVLSPVDKGIVPFVYSDILVPSIEVADFTGQSIAEALSELCEGFICVYDIYERGCGRFYYRESFNGSITLSVGDYRAEPQPIIERWQYWYDGVIVRNTEKDIYKSLGDIGHGKRVYEIDNRYITSAGMAKVIAEWLYKFFGMKRALITVVVPFLLEIEMFDKVTIILKDKDGGAFRTVECIAYSISFDSSPGTDRSNDITLKLLEKDGVSKGITLMPVQGNLVKV